MTQEDYVSFETAKLLKEKGFDYVSLYCYEEKGINDILLVILSAPLSNSDLDNTIEPHKCYSAPTLQMAMKWLRETHSILLVVDYDYECTDTSYFYKIYRLGEHGKPESVAVKGVSYDKDGNPTEHIAFYRDYERSYGDYGAYEEACEAGIKYCLENLI